MRKSRTGRISVWMLCTFKPSIHPLNQVLKHYFSPFCFSVLNTTWTAGVCGPPYCFFSTEVAFDHASICESPFLRNSHLVSLLQMAGAHADNYTVNIYNCLKSLSIYKSKQKKLCTQSISPQTHSELCRARQNSCSPSFPDFMFN